MQKIYARTRFYLWQAVIIVLFILSFFWTPIFALAIAVLVAGIVGLILEYRKLVRLSTKINGSRTIAKTLSLGDEQFIDYKFYNDNLDIILLDIYDNLPNQFQYRGLLKAIRLEAEQENHFKHPIKPLTRGKYQFGQLNAFLHIDMPGFLERKISFDGPTLTKVYPSIIQMKQYSMFVFSKHAKSFGIQRHRAIGDNDEFEQIRNYVSGDNMKSINWKATTRTRELMVNQYQDSRAQEIYCIIDKGRSMYMPFNGMSLLDYAINSSLVISNIVLKKYDKAGLITFSDQVNDIIKANSHPRQIGMLSEKLYAQKTDFKVSNYEQLNFILKSTVSKRAVLFLFTNFETQNDLERVMPYLRKVSRSHLLIVISFINSELVIEKKKEITNIEEAYKEITTEKLLFDKERTMQLLAKNGIQYILTRPEELSINVINKYLEIKAKRMK